MTQPLFHDLWQYDNPAATEAAFLALLPQIGQTNNEKRQDPRLAELGGVDG